MAISLSEYFDSTINDLAQRQNCPRLLQKMLGPDPALVKSFSRIILSTGTELASTTRSLGSDQTAEEGVLSVLDGMRVSHDYTRLDAVLYQPGDVEKIAKKYGVKADTVIPKFSFDI